MAETTYYFNSYSSSVWTNPSNMCDNNTSTWASVSGDSKVHTFNNNSATSKPGPIIHVYVRWYRKGSSSGGTYNKIVGCPKYSAGYGDFEWDQSFTTTGDWSSWNDITTGTNAPCPWTWSDLDTLGLDIVSYDPTESYTFYVAAVQLKVVYGALDELTESVALTDEMYFISGMPLYYYQPSTASQFVVKASDIIEFDAIEEDDSLLRNDVVVIGTGVNASTSDSSSISTYGRYKYRYENSDITNSTDAATIAGQILSNYKEPKTRGSLKIRGRTGINVRQQFTLDIPELNISNEQFEIVQYQHNISDKGFYTTIQFGQVPWDITREVQNLIRDVY